MVAGLERGRDWAEQVAGGVHGYQALVDYHQAHHYWQHCSVGLVAHGNGLEFGLGQSVIIFISSV